MRRQYLWRKQASHAWLRANETQLIVRFAQRVAFIERPGRKRITVEVYCARRSDAMKLVKNLGGKAVRASPTIAVSSSKALKIGARLVITNRRSRAHFTGRRNLIIPAAGAFGTGEHATTAMCLRMLEQVTRRWRNHWKMLDVGTGTGILALAARCFGATDVTAIDNDPCAIAIAQDNARLNRIRGIRFAVADATISHARGKVDVIAANLFSELLITAIPKWWKQLRPGGILILSGVLRSQEHAVVRALRRQKIAIEEIRRRGKWVAFLSGRAHGIDRARVVWLARVSLRQAPANGRVATCAPQKDYRRHEPSRPV